MSDDIGFPKPSGKKPKKPSRINAVTDERAAQKAIYARFVRPAFLAGLARGQGHDKPYCERCRSMFPERMKINLATEAHHIAGRDGEKLNDFTRLRGLCDPCHDYIHSHPEEAYAEGWMERRNNG